MTPNLTPNLISSASWNLVSEIENKTRDPQQSNKQRQRWASKKEQAKNPTEQVVESKERVSKEVEIVIPNSFPDEIEEHHKGKTPITKIKLDKKHVNFDIGSRYGGETSSKHKSSKASTMKKLPSFLEDKESNKEVRRVPSRYMPSPMILDMANLQALLPAPVKVTLPFRDILKVKLELWQEVVRCSTKMGINMTNQIPNQENINESASNNVKCEPVPINKVRNYCRGEDGNTTLLVEFMEVKSLAILDSKMGILIATKEV